MIVAPAIHMPLNTIANAGNGLCPGYGAARQLV